MRRRTHPIIQTKSVLTELTKTFHSKKILLGEVGLKEIQGQKALRNLVVLRYLAHYGDYLGEQCKRFRDSAVDKNVDGVQFFTGEGKIWNSGPIGAED